MFNVVSDFKPAYQALFAVAAAAMPCRAVVLCAGWSAATGGGTILDALRLTLTLSIVPFSNPIKPPDAMKLASNFPFLISIVPLIWAEPVSGCGVPAVNR